MSRLFRYIAITAALVGCGGSSPDLPPVLGDNHSDAGGDDVGQPYAADAAPVKDPPLHDGGQPIVEASTTDASPEADPPEAGERDAYLPEASPPAEAGQPDEGTTTEASALEASSPEAAPPDAGAPANQFNCSSSTSNYSWTYDLVGGQACVAFQAPGTSTTCAPCSPTCSNSQQCSVTLPDGDPYGFLWVFTVDPETNQVTVSYGPGGNTPQGTYSCSTGC